MLMKNNCDAHQKNLFNLTQTSSLMEAVGLFKYLQALAYIIIFNELDDNNNYHTFFDDFAQKCIILVDKLYFL